MSSNVPTAAAGTAVVFAAVTLCSPAANRQVATPPTFADLDRCPTVAGGETIPADGQPTKRIVHILDRPYVSRWRFEADLLNGEPNLSHEDISREWKRFLDEVEAD